MRLCIARFWIIARPVGERILYGSRLSLVAPPVCNALPGVSRIVRSYRSLCRSWVVACEDTLTSLPIEIFSRGVAVSCARIRRRNAVSAVVARACDSGETETRAVMHEVRATFVMRELARTWPPAAAGGCCDLSRVVGGGPPQAQPTSDREIGTTPRCEQPLGCASQAGGATSESLRRRRIPSDEPARRKELRTGQAGGYRSSSITTNVPGIIGGRGRGRSAVGAGAGPNSAVTV